MLKFNVLTIFPESFESYSRVSILGRALKKKLIKINLVDLKKFAEGERKILDDKPYGGGAGMVMKIEPIYKAMQSLKLKKKTAKNKTKIILFSTRGKRLNSKMAKELSVYNNLTLICGRYEGIDERVPRYLADEEISVGDYVLSGGELPAMVLIEAVSRFIPGVLGKSESLEEIKGFYSVYTRPEVFILKNKRKLKVPPVLLSGNHEKIKEWRKQGN